MQVRKTRTIGVDGEHRAIAIETPINAVPYRVLPDKITPANGLDPSLLTPEAKAVKVCRFV
jgi:hypothetical protein